MKRLGVILFFGLILLSGVYSVLAVRGVCTGTQTCFCSGRAVSCPCDADPCVICGPTSLECTGVQTGTPQTPTGNQGTGGSDYTNPQTPSDFLGLIGNGISNLVLTAFGQPSVVGGKVEISRPTAAEMIISIIALAALLAAAVMILKSIFVKIFISKAGASAVMSKAQPSRLNPTRYTKKNSDGGAAGEPSYSPRYNPRESYKPKRGPDFK